MNTSSISSSSSASASTGGGSNASQIQKQIAALQVKITKEQNSKDDAKTKVQLIEAYQNQIQELEVRLQQTQQAQQQKAQNNDQKTAAAGTGDKTSQESLTTEQEVEKKLNEPAPYDQKGEILDATA
jgi:FlxA-like protein